MNRRLYRTPASISHLAAAFAAAFIWNGGALAASYSNNAPITFSSPGEAVKALVDAAKGGGFAVLAYPAKYGVSGVTGIDQAANSFRIDKCQKADFITSYFYHCELTEAFLSSSPREAPVLE